MTYVVIFMLLLMVGRLLTSVVHELGHAVAGILLTGQKAVVYIGSYGDPGNSLHLKSRKLEMYFRYNPLSWTGGLCVSEAKEISLARQVIFTLAGPVASLLIAVPAVYVIFANDLNDAWKVAAIVFFIAAMLDLSNLIPRKTPIKLFDGSVTYNDGYTLWQLFSSGRHIKTYEKGVDFYNSGDYKKAAELFGKIIASGLAGRSVYRAAVSALILSKDYKLAAPHLEKFISMGTLTVDELCNVGVCYSQLNNHEKALEFYERALSQEPNHKFSLNNKGYSLNLSGKFEEAIQFFDRSIELDENFAYSYNNRGLSKIKTGMIEEGLKDINYGLELDPKNAYGYRNLGIYHADKGEYREALELFRKAKELDASTHMIDELINNAETQLNTFK